VRVDSVLGSAHSDRTSSRAKGSPTSGSSVEELNLQKIAGSAIVSIAEGEHRAPSETAVHEGGFTETLDDAQDIEPEEEEGLEVEVQEEVDPAQQDLDYEQLPSPTTGSSRTRESSLHFISNLPNSSRTKGYF
jgi:hypothetical protein